MVSLQFHSMIRFAQWSWHKESFNCGLIILPKPETLEGSPLLWAELFLHILVAPYSPCSSWPVVATTPSLLVLLNSVHTLYISF
jgi:hypothetical protein